jgi:hypothetical protein
MITFKQFLSEDNGDSGFELVKLIQSKHEISFKCDRYYAVRNTDISAEFLELLKND